MADEEIAAQSEPEAASQEASSSLELESLLREWDSERANGTSLDQPEEETGHSFDDVIAWARDAELDQRAADLANDQQAFENAKAMEQFEKDLQSTIGEVRGDLDKEFFDDELVGAWLDKKARDDLSLQQAFIDRQVDPRGWEERKRQLVNGFQKYAQRMPDPAVTQDVMAVAAAVRGANSAPRAEDQDAFNRRISHMGNQEFENYLKEIGAR